MEKRILALISLLMCLSLFLLPCTAYAASTSDAVEPISVSQKCSLTMKYAYNGTAFSGMSVPLYKIADVSSDYQYTLTDDFKATDLQLNGVSSTGEWNTIRTTLEAYVSANNIHASMVQSTNMDGQISFQDLTPGMYMVASVQCSKDGFRYYFASILTAVPDLNNDGTWNYDVTVTPKADVDNPSGEDLQYKVLKLWKDTGNAAKRPNSIEVDILRNGKTVKTVVLSDANHWSYTWYAEDDGSTWQVVEKNVPDGYVMTVEKRTTTFTIINSVPDEPDTPPDQPDNPDTPNTPTNPDVPKTGDTFNVGLYVMLICISGIVLVLLGITGKRKAE